MFEINVFDKIAEMRNDRGRMWKRARPPPYRRELPFASGIVMVATFMRYKMVYYRYFVLQRCYARLKSK